MVHAVIIIGSGPAGLTAALYTGRARLAPLVIAGKEPGGQLMGTTIVENWPGTMSIMGPQLMLQMQEQATAVGAALLFETVVSVDCSAIPYTVTTNSGTTYRSKSIIIATGAQPNRLGCQGEEEYWGKGVTVCAVCDGAFYRDKKVIVVGGGDTAMEDASFLTKFTNNITVVHIKDRLTASQPMQERVLANSAIKIIYNSTITAITGNGNHVTGCTIQNMLTGNEEKVATDGVFIAIGLKPATKPFIGQLPLNSYGYLQTIDAIYTEKPGIFVAGDVADFKYRQAITAAGSGCMAALACERYLEQQNDERL